MNISDIINRIDQHDIQLHFITKEAIKVLELLNDQIVQDKDNLKKLIADQWPHEEILRIKKLRNLMIDLLYKSEATDLAQKQRLNVSDNDVYEKLKRINFSKNSQNEKILFEFFGERIPEKANEESIASANDTIERIKATKELFNYQRLAFEEVVDHLDKGKKRCLLHMPTGAGKTITAMRAVAMFFIKQRTTKIIWLAHNEELCEQAIEEFKETWSHVGDRMVQTVRFFGGHSPDILEQTKEDADVLIVAGLEKIFEAEKRQDAFLTTLADRIKLVVMDEAHQATAPTYKIILEQLVEKRFGHVGLLGLSATPGRVEGAKSLAALFDHNKVTLKTDMKNPVEYLIREGYIARPIIKIVRSNSTITQEELRQIMLSRSDIPKKILERLGLDSTRNLKIIIEIEDLIRSGHSRIILFAPSLRGSIDISMILAARGHKAFHVDGNTPNTRRRKIVERFQNDDSEAMIMCNFGVFTAGFDVPLISAAVIARPTKSTVLYSQMAGRAMRGIKMGGNKECDIRTVTDINLKMFSSIVENFFRWEDTW